MYLSLLRPTIATADTIAMVERLRAQFEHKVARFVRLRSWVGLRNTATMIK